MVAELARIIIQLEWAGMWRANINDWNRRVNVLPKQSDRGVRLDGFNFSITDKSVN